MIRGYVIFSPDTAERARTAVLNAIIKAELDPTELGELAPRNVFIRAIRRLQKQDVIQAAGSDGILADRAETFGDVSFQLSRRYVEAQAVRYDPAAFISFDRETKQIRCTNPEIRQLAERLYSELAGVFTVGDLHALTKRLIDKAGARRISLRDGVFYIAAPHREIVTKVKKLYEALGFGYHTYAIAETEDTRALATAVVADIKATVEGIQTQIAEVRAEAGGVSKRLAKSKLRELKNSLAQYKELAASMGVSIKNLLEEAGTAGAVIEFAEAGDDVTALGALVQSGATLPALFTDLLESAEIVPLGGRDEIAPTTANEDSDEGAAVREDAVSAGVE